MIFCQFLYDKMANIECISTFADTKAYLEATESQLWLKLKKDSLIQCQFNIKGLNGYYR